MADKSFLNANSRYIDSLVSFILDTKPYHSKLTEIVEEYRFFDEMLVEIDDVLFSRDKHAPTWLYSFFSSGSSVNNRVPLKRLSYPYFYGPNDNQKTDGEHRAGRDEVTDLSGVPYVFSKKSFDGASIADAYLERADGTKEPMLEGHDFFTSKGSYEFAISQVTQPGLNYVVQFNNTYEATDTFPITVNLANNGQDYLIITGPATQVSLTQVSVTGPGKVQVYGIDNTAKVDPLWEETRVIGSMSEAVLMMRRRSNDHTKTTSALRIVRRLLQNIDAIDISSLPADQQTAINAALSTLLSPLADPVSPSWANLRSNAAVDLGVTTASLPQGYDLIVYLQPRLASLSPTTISQYNSLLAVLDSLLLPARTAVEPATTPLETLLELLDANGVAVPAPPVLLSGVTSFPRPAEWGTSTTFTDFPPLDGWLGTDTYTPDGADSNPDLEVNLNYVSGIFEFLCKSLYYGVSSDSRESGLLSYGDVETAGITVSNIVASPTSDVEEWTLTCLQTGPDVWQVSGTRSGIVGTVEVGSTFSASQISFNTAVGTGAATIGATATLTPSTKVVVAKDAPLETWNLIKVNPLAYTRPFLVSNRYGYIRSGVATGGVRGQVDVLNTAVADGTIILTARSDNPNRFDLVHTGDAVYTAVVAAANPTGINSNTEYNDGSLAFSIRRGTVQAFAAGDRFYIEVENPPAVATEFDLWYVYDADSYNHNALKYPDNTNINFRYDTRYTDYDLDNFNLVLAQNAVDQRKFRLVANADGAAIVTTKKDGSSSSFVDQQDSTSGVAPDVSSTAAPLYNNTPATGVGDAENDLQLFYANSFRLEYSDNGGGSWTSVSGASAISVGSTYTNSGLGISFTLAAGSRPFIAAISDDTPTNYVGGDAFAWTVSNPGPSVTNAPVGLTSPNVARLVMHGDGFYDAPPAEWRVSFTSTNNYTVSGSRTDTGAAIPSASGRLSTLGVVLSENFTYRSQSNGLHFTIVPGPAGMASGDRWEFTTLDAKPTILVHGTVSGWQPEAEIGRWYWNGKIGFKVPAPKVRVFDGINQAALSDTSFTVGTGTVTVTRLRPDADSGSYYFTETTDGWMVTKEGVGVVGWTLQNGVFTDRFITVDISGTTPTAAAPRAQFVVQVVAESFDFWNCPDVGIVRPLEGGRYPLAGEHLGFKKGQRDYLGISLDTSSVDTPVNLTPIFAPTGTPYDVTINIDERFIDLSSGTTPVSVTSPEVDILQGWLPLTLEPYDSDTSTAEHPDVASSFSLVSATTGQVIGTVKQTSTNIDEPVVVEWDTTFFNTYLTLNTQANIVTYGSGLNDKMRVKMSEHVRFVTDGGAFNFSALFNDNVSVNVDDYANWSILQSLHEFGSVAVADAPFNYFLPGYDNTQYDLEPGTVDGAFDFGLPLVDALAEAQVIYYILNNLPADPLRIQLLTQFPRFATLSDAELQQRLDDLIDLVQPYLNGDPAVTPIIELRLAIQYSVRTATSANITRSGTPTVNGVALQVNDLVLVKNQTTTSQNGVFVVQTGSWTRHPDFSTAAELDRDVIIVVEAGTLAGTTWTRAQPFVQYTYQAWSEVAAQSFGVAARGMGMSIDQAQARTVAASTVHDLALYNNDFGEALDAFPHDAFALDGNSEQTAVFTTSELRPIPNSPTGTYSTIDTPLEAVLAARVFDITFRDSTAAAFTVTAYSAAQPAGFNGFVVQELLDRPTGYRRFTFSLPVADSIKITVT